MSDQRIIDVIAAHQLVRVDRRAWWCLCGADCLTVEGSWAAHQLDALRRNRIAVVELPEPGKLSDHHGDNDTVFYHGQRGEFCVYHFYGEVGVADDEGFNWSPSRLRELAAAALAAAAKAQEEQ